MCRSCNLRHFMERNGMTPSEVADRIGVGKGYTVTRWANGYMPNSINRRRLLDLFGCTYEEMWPVKGFEQEIIGDTLDLSIDHGNRWDAPESKPVQEQLRLEPEPRLVMFRIVGNRETPVYILEEVKGKILGYINPKEDGSWLARTDDIAWRCNDVDTAKRNLVMVLDVELVGEHDCTVQELLAVR